MSRREKKAEDKKPSKRRYRKPEIKSEEYQEKAGLACNKMYGLSVRCNVNSAIS